MYITRRTSYILSVCIMVAFLGIGAFFFSSNTSEFPTVVSEVVEEPVNTSAPDPVTPVSEEEPSSEEEQSEDEEQSEGFALKNFHRSETKDGKVLWEIVGKNAIYHPDKKSVDIEQCIFSMAAKDDEQTTLLAGKATLFLNGPDLTNANFSETVTLQYANKMKLITDAAKYDRKENTVSSDDPVKIIGDWYVIEGIGLRADLGKENYRILKDVSSMLEPRKREDEKRS